MSDGIFRDLSTFLKRPLVLALVLTEMASLSKPGNNLKWPKSGENIVF